MSDITQWDPVDANNSDVPPDGFPEGMPASAVNDASRAVMGSVRRHAEDGGWFDWGHAATYVSGTVFQVPGDLSAVYQVGRRVRATQTATITGTIGSIAVSGNTDVTVVWDSGALANEALAVAVGLDPAIADAPDLGTAAALDAGTAVGDLVQLVDAGAGAARFPAAIGGAVLLDARTLSGSLSETWTVAQWFTDYRHLVLEYDGIVPSIDGAALYFRVSEDGGATYVGDAGGTDYRILEATADGVGAWSSEFNERDRLGAAGQIGSLAGFGVHGQVQIRGLSGRPYLMSNAVWYRTGVTNNISSTQLWCYMPAISGGINALKILMDTGALASGGVRLYGYA